MSVSNKSYQNGPRKVTIIIQNHSEEVKPHSCCPLHTESPVDTLSCFLCESYRCRIRVPAEVRRSLCKWKSRQRGTGACRSDDVHSLTAKQILHSSNKREMSHTSTHKATLQDRITVMWQLVVSLAGKREKYCTHTWKSLWHPVCPADPSSHFCLKNSICPQQREPGESHSWMWHCLVQYE